MSTITKEQVLLMDWKSVQAAIKNPATSADMQNLLRDRQVVSRVSELMLEAQNREAEVDAQLSRVVPPSTEQLAAEAVAMAAEPVVAPVEPVVVTPPPVSKSYEEEDGELKKVGVTVVRDASGVVTRYIQEYQVLGEDGKAIGRPTHLESRTLPELFVKQKEVHTQATRAFHRVKQQKLTFKNEKTILTPEAIAEAARVALEGKDPAKVTDLIHGVIETEYQKREHELREKQLYEDGREISNIFMARHLHDYNPCEANQKAIGDYFAQHNLEFTLDNLEVAFQDLKEQGDKLADVVPISATRQVAVVANPTSAATTETPATPAIPAAETTIVVPVSVKPAQPAAPSQPVVEATVTTPVTAPNVQPVTRRPGVNGAIAPGTLSAQRPGAPDPALARKEFLKTVRDMKPDVMRHKLKTDPQFVTQLKAYGIQIR
jgi:hypothetical protein